MRHPSVFRLTALCAVLLLPVGAGAPGRTRARGFDYAGRVGLVATRLKGLPMLFIRNSSLEAGDSITVISVPGAGEDRHPIIGSALVTVKDRPHDPRSRGPDTWYYLAAGRGLGRRAGICFAVTGRFGSLRVRGARVLADFEGDGIPEVFQVCRGRDRLHYVIWSDRAGTGRLRWHRSRNYAYTFEPTCGYLDSLPEIPGPAD